MVDAADEQPGWATIRGAVVAGAAADSAVVAGVEVAAVLRAERFRAAAEALAAVAQEGNGDGLVLFASSYQ